MVTAIFINALVEVDDVAVCLMGLGVYIFFVINGFITVFVVAAAVFVSIVDFFVIYVFILFVVVDVFVILITISTMVIDTVAVLTLLFLFS